MSATIARRLSFVLSLACRFRTVLPVACLAMLSTWADRAGAESEIEDKRERARAHFDRANDAFAEGDIEMALDEYRVAWSLHRAYDVACNLGRVESELGYMRDAAEHLAYCLENFPASTRSELREAEANARELYLRVSTKTGALRLQVDPPEAQVLLDGRPASRVLASGLVFVEPGEHRVRAQLDGYESLERTLDVAAGQERDVALQLRRIDAARADSSAALPTAAPPDAGTTGRETSSTARTVAILAGASLATVGLGLGIGMLVRRGELSGEVDALDERSLDELGPSGCHENDVPLCNELSDKVDAKNQASVLATVGFAAAAVFGTGTVAAVLLWPKTSRDVAERHGSASHGSRVGPAPLESGRPLPPKNGHSGVTLRLVPRVGPAAAHMSLSGTF